MNAKRGEIRVRRVGTLQKPQRCAVIATLEGQQTRVDRREGLSVFLRQRTPTAIGLTKRRRQRAFPQET